MTISLHPSAQRVQDAVKALGFDFTIVEFAETTRTAEDAAKAIGCTVAQIAKSLVFKGKESGKPILVIASGANRVNEKAVEAALGEPIGRADAEFVRERTSFVIGGVPPVGHAEILTTFIDEDLLKLDEIWAAAGTPNAVFRLKPNDLLSMTTGTVLNISEGNKP